MYSTCTFCGGRLGTNEVIEAFPVGRRVAFDPGKGRLWALCPRCRQWNLAPLEERWEALESLERTWRETPTRYSTGEMAVARVPEGLELVRIGRPALPEYAAWRYGGELIRRRRKAILTGGAGVAIGGLILGGTQVGLLAGGAFGAIHLLFGGASFYRNALRTAARVELPDGESVVLKERHVRHAALHRDGDGWKLEFPHLVDLRKLSYRAVRGAAGALTVTGDPRATLRGEAAVHAAARILPALNQTGASARRVEDACRFVEEAGSADEAFRRALRTHPSSMAMLTAPARAPHGSLHRLPAPVRLGLEMAAQESTERRALEGELAALEREWREAEEVAAIADDLLLPDRIRRFLGR